MSQEILSLHGENCISSSASCDPYLDFLNSEIRDLLHYASRLANIDACTENITKPLRRYPRGIVFEDLGDRSHNPNRPDGTFSINSRVVDRFRQTISTKEIICFALLIYVFHEAAHSSQGLKDYEDVQRMKKVEQSIGRGRLGELDLRSDFWAARTLSLFMMLKYYGEYNDNRYIENFRHIWCEICGAMLKAFPVGDRKDKQQRVFGYLLMAKLTADAYEKPPLRFCAELWPEWSPDLKWLSIYSNSYPSIHGEEVDSDVMTQVLTSITNGDFDKASHGIAKIWSQITKPRRENIYWQDNIVFGNTDG